MPEMNGIEFLKAVRTSKNTIAFVLFTGRGREEVVIQALNEGADFYLQKGGEPVSQFTEIEHKVKQAVRKRLSDELLHEKEIQLRATLASTADGILAVDNNGKVVQDSPRFTEIWQVPPSVMESGDDRILLNFVLGQLNDPDAFLEKVEELYNSDAVGMDTLALRDGRIIERYSFPMIMDGTRIGRVWSFRDVTECNQVEKALRESEQRYRNVVEDQTEFISRFLPDGTHIFANEAYSRYFGWKRDGIIGYRFQPKIPLEDQERVKEFFGSLTPGHPVDIIEHRIIMPDGTIRWQRWSDRAIFDSLGAIIEYQSVRRDVTEKKIAEAALEESEIRFASSTRTIPWQFLPGGIKTVILSL